jgi:hypothetical protein
MKKHILNLVDYKVGDKDIDVTDEFYQLLRMAGVYQNGLEMCDGIILAKSLWECKEATIEITDVELTLLKKVMNVLIKRPHNPPMTFSLGGPRYEELILRVFMLDRE